MLANNLLVWWIAQVAAIAILVVLFFRWRPGFLGGRTIWQAIAAALDARQARIREQLEAAQRSREEAERLHQEALADVERARVEAREIVARAGQTSEAIQRELESRATEEYQRIMAQARSQIDYERERAEMALQRRAADIVIGAAREVIERNIEPSTDRHIIDSSLESLKEIG